MALVKLDEDLTPLVAAPLVAAGHEVRTVPGQGWGGMADDELLRRVAGERALFVTADKGFGDIRAYPPGSHAGIVLLRPAGENLLSYRGLVEQLLTRYDLDALAGALAVVTPHGVRIRRRA